MTPTTSNTGASHERSKDRTWTTAVEPRSAPNMMASAGVVANMPLCAKETVSSAVAVELCSTVVTPSPGQQRGNPVADRNGQRLLQALTVSAFDARAHQAGRP